MPKNPRHITDLLGQLGNGQIIQYKDDLFTLTSTAFSSDGKLFIEEDIVQAATWDDFLFALEHNINGAYHD